MTSPNPVIGQTPPKRSFWRRLGEGLQRYLPVVEKGAARLAFAAGNRAPLALILEREQRQKDEQRQAVLDEMAQESHAQQIAIGQRQLDMPVPETPEQKRAADLMQARKMAELEQEFKPPTPFSATTQPTGRPLMLRKATGEVEPMTTQIPRPELGPKPIMGPLIKSPETIKAPLFEPPPFVKDTSLNEAELAERAARGDAVAADALRRLAEQKKAGRSVQGIPGTGIPMFEDPQRPGVVTGAWFPENNQIVRPPSPFRKNAPNAAETESLAGFDTLLNQFSKLETMAKVRPDAIGFVAGRVGNVRAQTLGGDPEAASIYQTAKDIQNQLVYLMSGKQINEKEYARLKEALPDPSLPLDTFNVRMANFKARLQEVMGSRRQMMGIGGVKQGMEVQVTPAIGSIEDGYRFKGGNPADPNNWEKVVPKKAP